MTKCDLASFLWYLYYVHNIGFYILFIEKVVTCGNVPLESSFHRVPRCVYTSTCLYEYRGWGSKPANASHRRFTWGLRSAEVSSGMMIFHFTEKWSLSVWNVSKCINVTPTIHCRGMW